jgi:CII-binding regulator of phage lambda lysogenization HflD
MESSKSTATTDSPHKAQQQTDIHCPPDRTNKPPAINTDETVTTIGPENLLSTDPKEATDTLTLSRLLERLDRVASMKRSGIKQQIQQMESRLTELTPADRYELALLLTRKSSSNKTLKRAISILDSLQERVKDSIVSELIQLHRRYLALKKQYHSERNKTTELNKKIERLKGLEQDLDKSNERIQESLNPTPGETQQQ